MHVHDVRLLEVRLGRDHEMREAAEHRLARTVRRRDGMPGRGARLLSRLPRRAAGEFGGVGAVPGTVRGPQPAHLAASPERDMVLGVHDLTGLGGRGFVQVPMEVGREGG